MPETVRIGSRGPTVVFLQTQLNLVRPDLRPPLAVDGIFGPKTQARVMQFQRDRQLQVDGIVGPKTWAALLKPRPVLPLPTTRTSVPRCGNPDRENSGLIVRIERERVMDRALANPDGGGASSDVQGFNPLKGLPRPITRFTSLIGHRLEGKARAVYGTSLDYSTIVITNALGIFGRPFTNTAFNAPPRIPHDHLVNVGTLDPPEDLLIHELAHVWQSQHASNVLRYMPSCIRCMQRAATTNLTLVATDPSIALHPDFPANFPMSAFAYLPGQPFDSYGPEQIAQQAQNGEAPILALMKTEPPGFSAADNEAVLDNTTAMADLRDPNVRFGRKTVTAVP